MNLARLKRFCELRVYFQKANLSFSHKCTGSWSYAHGVSDTPLIGRTIGQQFDRAVELTPDREAVVFKKHEFRQTFAQFKNEVDELAAGLVALGLQPGDRLGIWGPNTPAWITTQFAAAKVGLILVVLNPAYRVNELEYAMRLSGCKALISAQKFKKSCYLSMLTELLPELAHCKAGQLESSRLPQLKHVILLDKAEDIVSDDTLISPLALGVFSYKSVSRAGDSSHFKILENLASKLQADSPINIQFTSGTTGQPKGATLTHHGILNNSIFTGIRCGFQETKSRICVPVPFYHCFGMVLGNMQLIAHNATCIYPSPSFDAEATLAAVHCERATALYGTPTMYIDQLEHSKFNQYNLTSLNSGIIASSPCPIEIVKRLMTDMHMINITVAYGSTETSPVSFQSTKDDSLEQRVGSIGRVSEHTEVKIVDSDNNILPIGERGEILTRGYSTMLGYWGDEIKTRECITPDHWYRTGDIGYLDSDGYGHIDGRIKDMVIRGGENIYPTEIENFLHKHEKVLDVQVIGVPDKRMGEELMAWIKVKEQVTISEKEILDFCRNKIAHFKIPRYIRFVKEFPMTVTGKVQKFKLKEIAMKELNQTD